MRRLKQAAVVIIVLGVGAQFIRPDYTGPPTDPSRTIQAAVPPTSPLPAVLDRSCSDCHSNRTVRSWYTEIAPLSWLMARSVTEGRKAINFSEWAGYPPDVQRALLKGSCDAATSGKMPGPYTLFRPDSRLSAQDVETICMATKQQ